MFIKLKAGALQFTMFVIVVVALLLASFILVTHVHNRFKKDTRLLTETIAVNDSVITQWLHTKAVLKGLDTSLNTSPIINIDSRYWGVYQTLHVTSKIQHKTSNKIAFIGSKQSETHPTLFLKDNNKPLVLVGNTTIKGNVQLPEKGVRTGNISGVSYYGDQLIQGNVHTISEFPKVSEHLYNYLDVVKESISRAPNEQYITLNQNDVITNSFYDKVKIIYEQGMIALKDIKLTGHIIVYSDTKIEVDASASLTDVVLVAPNIDIGNRVQGRFQALASKSILVGNECQLSYPSALVLQPRNVINIENSNTTADIMINISESSSVTGSVVYLGEPEEKNYKPQIFIDQNTIVKGEVYCTGNADIRGAIHGTIYAHDFIAAQSGSIYQNHLYNAEIIREQLPDEFSGILFEASKRKVMKWLY